MKRTKSAKDLTTNPQQWILWSTRWLSGLIWLFVKFYWQQLHVSISHSNICFERFIQQTKPMGKGLVWNVGQATNNCPTTSERSSQHHCVLQSHISACASARKHETRPCGETTNDDTLNGVRAVRVWDVCVLTYRDNAGRDESPANFEEQRRREAQHHLNIFKIVPVTYRMERRTIESLKQVKIGPDDLFFAFD